jgi:hypothetical protein
MFTAFLHAHQLSIIIGSEPGTAAMVSRSRDGQLVVPALKLAGCVVFRGSKKSNNRARGGHASDRFADPTRAPAARRRSPSMAPAAREAGFTKASRWSASNSGAAYWWSLPAQTPLDRDPSLGPNAASAPFHESKDDFAEPIFRKRRRKVGGVPTTDRNPNVGN